MTLFAKQMLTSGIILLLVFAMASMSKPKPATASGSDLQVGWGVVIDYKELITTEKIDGNGTVSVSVKTKEGVDFVVWDHITSMTGLLWVPSIATVSIEFNPNCAPERVKRIRYMINNVGKFKEVECDAVGRLIIKVTPEEMALFQGNIKTLHIQAFLEGGKKKSRWVWVIPFGTSSSPSENFSMPQWKVFPYYEQDGSPRAIMQVMSEMQKRFAFGGSPSDPMFIVKWEAEQARNCGPKDGKDGTNGKDGTQVFCEPCPPKPEIGKDCDIWIDTAAFIFYKKVNGCWIKCSESFRGIDGLNGLNGKDGTDSCIEDGDVYLHINGVWPMRYGEKKSWLHYRLYIDGQYAFTGSDPQENGSDAIVMWHHGDPNKVAPNVVTLVWYDPDCMNIVSSYSFLFTHLTCHKTHYILPIGKWQDYVRPLPDDKSTQLSIFEGRRRIERLDLKPLTSSEYVRCLRGR